MTKPQQPSSTPTRFQAACAPLAAAIALLAVLACNPASAPPAGSGSANTATALKRPESPAKPNVIFIVVDTLRADRLSSYGHPGPLKTPNIDALAAEGALFQRAISPAPWTLPAIGSIFTGYPPCIHKATSYLQVESMDQGKTPAIPVLDESFETLAERFQLAGYQTAGLCGNKFIQKKYGFAQGFEHFDTSFAANNVSGQKLNAALEAWLQTRDPQRPLFLYLHYMDPHGPYDAAPEFHDPLIAAVEQLGNKTRLTPQQFQQVNLYLRAPPAWATDSSQFERLRYFREYWIARYEAGVAQFDHNFGRLREQLRGAGLWDDSLIVFTADHGEALGDQTLFGQWTVWDHGMTQHQTDLHVPLLVRWPGVIAPGTRIPQTAGTIGLYGTLLDLLGWQSDDVLAADSLLGHLQGQPRRTTVIADALKATNQFFQLAAFQDHWKLILTSVRGSQGASPRLFKQLFDLDADPGEKRDLAAQQPERVSQLNELLGQYGQNCRNPVKRVEPRTETATPEEVRRLGQLGYVAGGADDEDEDEDAVDEGAEGVPDSQPASQSSSQPRP